MKYSELSRRVRTDLQIVLGVLGATGQDADALIRAIDSDAVTLEHHIIRTLGSATWENATPAIRQRVGMLMNYAIEIKTSGESYEYGRDRQARLAQEANTKHGRTSWRASISLRNDIVGDWDAMSPEERGDWIAERWDAN